MVDKPARQTTEPDAAAVNADGQDLEIASVASALPPLTAEEIEQAKKKFEEGVISRGEAVEAGKTLPPGATHEIVGHSPDGSPILKRRRFSLR